jgi:hypothetical protein
VFRFHRLHFRNDSESAGRIRPEVGNPDPSIPIEFVLAEDQGDAFEKVFFSLPALFASAITVP